MTPKTLNIYLYLASLVTPHRPMLIQWPRRTSFAQQSQTYRVCLHERKQRILKAAMFDYRGEKRRNKLTTWKHNNKKGLSTVLQCDCACMRAWVRACVRVRVCVRACQDACVRAKTREHKVCARALMQLCVFEFMYRRPSCAYYTRTRAFACILYEHTCACVNYNHTGSSYSWGICRRDS